MFCNNFLLNFCFGPCPKIRFLLIPIGANYLIGINSDNVIIFKIHNSKANLKRIVRQ